MPRIRTQFWLLAMGVLSSTTVVNAQHHTRSNSDNIQTAAAAGQFRTLITALVAADLLDTLRGPGPFTILAPTDEAFAKLPEGTLARLLKPENKAELTRILKYHVIKGKVSAREAIAVSNYETLQGNSVNAQIIDGRFTINKAKVLKSDLPTSNGVIHVIDQVLLPKSH